MQAPLSARHLRNLPMALGVLRRHLGRHRSVAAARVLRALPSGVRTTLARHHRRMPGALGPILLGVTGQHSAAADRIHALADRGAERRRPRLVRAAVAAGVALHDAAAATGALARLDAGDPQYARYAALAEAERGHLSSAVQHLDLPEGRAERRLLARLAGELTVLSPTGAPPAWARAGSSRAHGTLPVDRRVLHLVTNALPEVQAGYTTRTHGIAAAQRVAGWDAQVATRIGFPVTVGALGAAPVVVHDGVPYHRLLPGRPLPRTDDRLLDLDVRTTARLVARLRPAVLHAHSKYVNARVALTLREQTGLPVVYEVRGFLEETWLSRHGDATADVYRLARESETEAMRAADAVVTISEGMRADILARGVDPARLHVVPNSVDDRFTGEPPDPAALRSRLGIAEDEVVIGTISTLNGYEGADLLITAVHALRAAGHRVRALVVGDGPERPALVRLAADLDEPAILPGRVPFATTPEHHAAIDIFCVPRRRTPVTEKVTPIKPLEAMATGRPVVASDLAPLREIVRPGSTGALVVPDDGTALVDALATLVRDPAGRRRMGAAARDVVLTERTWRQAALLYGAIYARLTGSE